MIEPQCPLAGSVAQAVKEPLPARACRAVRQIGVLGARNDTGCGPAGPVCLRMSRLLRAQRSLYQSTSPKQTSEHLQQDPVSPSLATTETMPEEAETALRPVTRENHTAWKQVADRLRHRTWISTAIRD